MIRRCLLPCLVVIAATLTGCGSTADYRGPSLRFGLGYDGVELSVILLTKGATASQAKVGSAPPALFVP